MKIIPSICIILLSVATLTKAEDFRISSVSKTKHEALVLAHQKLPSNAVVKRTYYSGSGNLNFCFVVYEKRKNK
jgi:hypothetical protein